MSRLLVAGVAGALVLSAAPAVHSGFGAAARAEVVSAPPAAQLAAPELVGSNGADLRWTPPSLAADMPLVRYEVHRSRSAGFTPSAQTLVGQVGAGAPAAYRDTTAAAASAFSYRVVTVVDTATGQQTSTSGEVRVTTPAAGDAVLTVAADSGAGGGTEVRQLTGSTAPCDDARNYGAAPAMLVGAEPGAVHRALVRFDLRAIPPTATVRGATLRLPYAASAGGQPVAIEVRRATRAWAEGGGPAAGACDGSGASWLDAKGGVRWSAAGGDAAAQADATIQAADRSTAGADTVSVTDLVAGWVVGRQANHGVLLRSADESTAGGPQTVAYDSDEAADPVARPTLTVSYVDDSVPRGPRAVLSTPVAGSRVHGDLPVTAAATDDGRVIGVEFLVDGQVAGTDATAPYQTSVATAGLTGGAHSLAIRATDDAGNTTTSSAVPVTVDNTNPPTATVTAPAANTRVTGPTAITVSASDDAAVRSVDVLVDGIDIGSDDTSPYQVTWDPEDPLDSWYGGTHTITARVTDSSGQIRESAPVAVELDRGNATKHSARLALGDPDSTADDVLPSAVAENTAVSAPTQDPYAGTVDADGVSGGSLDRSVKSAPVDTTGGITGCPANAYCTTVNVTNTSSSTWDGSQVRLWSRWYADNGATLFEGPGDGSLPASFPPGASATVGVRILPPRLPQGTELARYHLRIDLYDQATGEWFAADGSKPLDNPVQVAKDLADKLGLEKFWTYEGSETGASSLALTNVANGNMLWRWTPWTSAGRGLATVLDITYNSLEDHSSSPLGSNVSLAISGLARFGEPLDIHPNKADQISGHSNKWIEFTDGDGTVHRFTGNDDGTWSRPPGVHLFLRPVSSDAANPRYWALSRPDGVTFYFEHDGYPTSVRDRDSNEITFTLEDTPAGDPGGPKRRVTAVTDADGRAYRITYWSKSDTHRGHVRGKVRRITDHSGHALDFDYYDDGNLLRIIQRGGVGDDGVPVADRSFVYTYTDSSGAGFAIPDPANRVDPDPKTPNESTRIATIRDPRGNETLFTYYGPGSSQLRWRLKSRTDRSGAVTTFGYDLAAQQTMVTAPLSRVTRYRYDTDGKATAVVNAKNETASYQWTADFHVARVSEDNGNATTFDYDADSGYLTRRTDALGNTTTLDYERRPVDASDPGRHFVLLSTVTQPEGVASAAPDDFQYRFGYDGAGNPVTQTDPAGFTTRYDWNLAGSAAPGTLRRLTDQRGGVTEMSDFDTNGLPQTIVDPEGGVTRFGYDADGLLRFTQNPTHERFNGQSDVRSYRAYVDYDPFRRQIRTSKPRSADLDRGLLVWQVIAFDPNGNQVSTGNPVFGREQPPTGPRTEIGYDVMDRPTSALGPDRTLAGGERVVLAYDVAGRLVSRTSPLGAATATDGNFSSTYGYDALDRVIRTTRNGAAGETPRTSWVCYDNVGNRTAVVAPNAGLTAPPACPDATGVSHTTRFIFDATHRLVAATDALGNVTRSEYNRNGWVTAVVDPRGKLQTTTYDQRGLPVERAEPYIPGGRDLTSRMEYDAAGNLTKQISPRAVDKSTTTDYVTTLTYDKLNRLIRTTLPKDGSTDVAYEHVGYDADGRVTVKSLPVTDTELNTVGPNARSDITYFDTGWVASTDDPGNPQVLFDYTPEGWQTTRTPRTTDDNASPPDESQLMRWTYNPDGTLAARVDQGGQAATYDYDRDNHLVKASVASGVVARDERPVVTTMTYNGFDEIVRGGTTKQLDDSTTRVEEFTTFGYDADGNLVSRGDDGKTGAETADVKRNVFDYDAADRLVSQFELGRDTSCAGDRRITMDWQVNNWLAGQTIAKATDACAVERSTDPAAWQTTEQQTKSYFDNGMLRTMVTRNGAGEVRESHELGYEQDGGFTGQRTTDAFRRVGPAAGKPCSASTCTETWRYDARGKLVRHDDGNGGVTTYTLDAPDAQRDPQVRAGNVTRQAAPDRTIDRRYVGNQLENQTSGGVTTKNWYDNLGRLDCVTLSTGSQADCSPSSSAVSDKLLTDYTYDYLDRLESVRTYQSAELRDESVYRYDALDRTTTQVETHKRDGTLHRRTDFTYLGSSRLVAAETIDNSGTTDIGEPPPDKRTVKSYSYDAYGQRYHMSDLDSEKQPDGTFLERERTSVTYGYDPHASVSLLLKDSGAGEGDAKAVYGYTPYGDNADALSDGDEDKLNPFNPYRYTGKRWDSGSQTLDMGARNYDPGATRFLQQDVFRKALSDLGLTLDPLAQNRYALAGGNPTSFIEFDGHRMIANGGGGTSVPVGPNEDPSDQEEWWQVWGQRHETAVQFTAFLLRLLDKAYNNGEGRVTTDRASNRVIGGSAKGNGEDGYADVIYWTKDTIWVWEIKPAGGPAEAAGPAQLDRYVAQLQKQYPNMTVQKGFPLAPRYGPNLGNPSETITVESSRKPGAAGIELYTWNEGPTPRRVPVTEPVPETRPVPVPVPGPAPNTQPQPAGPGRPGLPQAPPGLMPHPGDPLPGGIPVGVPGMATSSGGGVSAGDVAAGGAAAAGIGVTIWWLGKLLSPACGPLMPACAIAF